MSFASVDQISNAITTVATLRTRRYTLSRRDDFAIPSKGLLVKFRILSCTYNKNPDDVNEVDGGSADDGAGGDNNNDVNSVINEHALRSSTEWTVDGGSAVDGQASLSSLKVTAFGDNNNDDCDVINSVDGGFADDGSGGDDNKQTTEQQPYHSETTFHIDNFSTHLSPAECREVFGEQCQRENKSEIDNDNDNGVIFDLSLMRNTIRNWGYASTETQDWLMQLEELFYEAQIDALPYYKSLTGKQLFDALFTLSFRLSLKPTDDNIDSLLVEETYWDRFGGEGASGGSGIGGSDNVVVNVKSTTVKY